MRHTGSYLCEFVCDLTKMMKSKEYLSSNTEHQQLMYSNLVGAYSTLIDSIKIVMNKKA